CIHASMDDEWTLNDPPMLLSVLSTRRTILSGWEGSSQRGMLCSVTDAVRSKEREPLIMQSCANTSGSAPLPIWTRIDSPETTSTYSGSAIAVLHVKAPPGQGRFRVERLLGDQARGASR